MSRVAFIVAVGCSFALTLLTIPWSHAPTEWARLDSNGVYSPQAIDYRPSSNVVQVALWVGMVAGLWLSVREHQSNGTARPRIAASRAIHVYLPIVVLTLIGFGLRIHTLGDLPLIIDEIGFAARASDILHGQGIPIFAPGHNAMPITTSWLMAGAMALFGQTTFAMRLIPLFFATLSIPAIYLLGTTWWSRRTGLIAATFLATFPAHIHFSRFALNNLIDPVFTILALVFLTRARRHGSRRDYIFAGIFAGTAQYFYQGSRLLLALIAVYWLFHKNKAAQRHNQVRMKRDDRRFRAFAASAIFRNLLWLVLPLTLLALPRFAPILVGGLPISGNTRPIELPPDWQTNALRSALAWVNQPDTSPFWLSDAPLLELPALLTFAAGLFVALRRWRDRRYIVLLVAVPLTTIFGGVIWAAAPLFVRYMTATPAIALLVTLGVDGMSGVRLPMTPPHDSQHGLKRGVPHLSMNALVIVVICIQGMYAAIQHSPEARTRITNSQWWEDSLARQAGNLPANVAAVWVVPTALSDTQWITVVDYVAAYGQRRAVVVNDDGGATLSQQLSRLGQPYHVFQIP